MSMALGLGLDIDTAQDQGLTEPRLARFLRGHEAIEEKLASLIHNGKIPHGLMFCGPRGIGKASLAHKLAKYLLTRESAPQSGGLFSEDEAPSHAPQSLDYDPNHPQIALYQGGAHPDCLILERAYDDTKNRYKDSLDVAELRKITPFLRRTASDGGWRIVLVDDADTMNRNAQNALLKMLEEPPSKTIIILIAHRPGRLIPTIHSRTQQVMFSPLSEQDLTALLALAEEPPTPAEAKIIAPLANGSIGAALEIINQGGLEAFTPISQIIEDGILKQNWEAMHALIDSQGKGAGANDKIMQLLRMMLQLLRIATLEKAKGTAQGNPAIKAAGMEDFINRCDLQTLTRITDDFAAHINNADHANLDKKHALLLAIHLIENAFHGLS